MLSPRQLTRKKSLVESGRKEPPPAEVDNFAEDGTPSPARVVQETDGRLERYKTKTPDKEREQVDSYFVEAFTRNYTSRQEVSEPTSEREG